VRRPGIFILSVALLLTAACQREPRGKYISHVTLPTGMHLLEQAEFRSNGTCLFGHPPDFLAECSWTRRGDIVTIERRGHILAKLRFQDKDLVLVDGDKSHTPFQKEK